MSKSQTKIIKIIQNYTTNKQKQKKIINSATITYDEKNRVALEKLQKLIKN